MERVLRSRRNTSLHEQQWHFSGPAFPGVASPGLVNDVIVHVDGIDYTLVVLARSRLQQEDARQAADIVAYFAYTLVTR